MVIFRMSLVAGRGQVPSLASTLRQLSLHAQRDRGCLGSQLSTDASDPNTLHYTEEWATERDFWVHVRSERFQRLIAVMETAAEQPRVSILLVSRSYGLEYIQDVLRSAGS